MNFYYYVGPVRITRRHLAQKPLSQRTPGPSLGTFNARFCLGASVFDVCASLQPLSQRARHIRHIFPQVLLPYGSVKDAQCIRYIYVEPPIDHAVFCFYITIPLSR